MTEIHLIPDGTALGMPLFGEVLKHDRTGQRPAEELRKLLDEVLADPFIHSVGWHQYTEKDTDDSERAPEFLVHFVWARTVDDVGDEHDHRDDSDFDVCHHHPSLGIFGRDEQTSRTIRVERSPEVQASYARCMALAEALDRGDFLDVLYDELGDEAEVTVDRDGIVLIHLDL
jgi:hypothetical protein